MRATPTAGTTGTAANYGILHNGDNIVACSAVPSLNALGDNPTHTISVSTSVSSGLDAGDVGVLLSNNNVVSFISFDAEL